MYSAHSFTTFSILFFSIYIINITSCGVMHSHTNEINKERVEDGSFVPRDQGHFSDSGEHNSEFDHEAILGSHKDADEYDHLPPEVAKERLTILLKKMDLSKDQFITRKELKAWILRSFKLLSEEESNDRFEDADANNDGVLTWSEYLYDTYGISQEKLQYHDSEEKSISDDKAFWKVADKNGDEKLDATEWVSFNHPEEDPNMLPLILEHTLRDKDEDLDGGISFQEFVGVQALNRDQDWLLVEKTKFDKEHDKDGDGRLTGNEILSWVVPSNEDIAEEEVDHLFAASDDDHDDLLSFDEALSHYDVFVGSEATDYGDHLHNIEHFNDEL